MAVTPRDAEAGVVGQRMTLDELLALPETWPALEYAEGVVTQKVAPQAQHMRLQLSFASRVNEFAEPLELGSAFPELRTTYVRLSRVPDVAVYAWDRIALLPDGRLANQFDGPPDIAVEILSLGQSMTDQIEKCIWYVKNGVRIALVVDPDHETMLRFRPDAVPDFLRGDDRIDLDEVLPGFELTVNQLFSSLRFRSRMRPDNPTARG
jgi:Uma2 family endonuclease